MTERILTTVIGVLIVIAAQLLRTLAGLDDAVATTITGLGLGLAAIGPSMKTAKPDDRGFTRLGVMLGLTLVSALAALVVGGMFALATGGCLPRQVTAERSIDVDVSIGPPCVATLSADGAIAGTATGPTCSRALLEYYRFRTGLDPLDKTAEPEGDAP